MNFVFGGRKIDAITLDPQRQFPDTVLEDDYWLRNAARRCFTVKGAAFAMTKYTAKAVRASRTATEVEVMLAFSACAHVAASTARTPIDVTPAESARSTPGDAQGTV